MLKKVFYLLILPLLIFALVVGGYVGYSVYQINHIPKVEIRHTYTYKKTFTVDKNMISYLVFSTGSKGLAEGDGERLNIGDYRAKMNDGLTDSIMLVLTNPLNREVSVVSIPRDTYIESKGQRINSSFNAGGINSLLDDVEYLTGVRPQHSISLNFAAFADLVDAVGGIDINVPTIVKDEQAHLSIPTAGCFHFDGPTALAFARSRHYRVSVDGINFKNDASSTDWGRIERQQAILRIVAQKILNPSIITTLPTMLEIAQKNITLDSSLTFSSLINSANAWKDGVSNIYAVTYPGVGKTLPVSKAQVIMPSVDQGKLITSELSTKIGFTASYDPTLVNQDSIGVLPSATPSTSGSPDISSTSKSFISERSANGLGGKYYSSCNN